MRDTSTDYARPHRPRAIAALNAAARVLPAAALTPDALVRAAERRAGGADDGSDGYRARLEVLCRSLEEEARLSPVGRFVTRERLLGVLANRVRAQRAMRKNPWVAALELEPPIVIAGLQRTGTTLLHRLLAADPSRRWLASWEALNPVPLGRGADLRESPRARIRIARTSERVLGYLAPDFAAVHPVEAQGPEEDVMLLDASLHSTVPEATLRVPSFARWLESEPATVAYRGMATLMKLLSAQRGSRAWVLKSPHHLEHLDALLEVFPGAKILWTHRDPAVCVPSFLSMVAHARGIFSDEVDPREVGREWLRKTARLVERALLTRARRPDAFIDVPYAELTADPIRTLQRVSAELGAGWDPHLERRVRARLASHPQHRHGRHVYRAEDFGLDADSVRAPFASYLAGYDGMIRG